MKKKQISVLHARRIILNAQLLDGRTKFPKGKEGAAKTIETLGYVQIDPLSVIHQAQHQTLWTRLPDYEPEMLQELQAKDRRVFEYWTHALAFLPMSDYRYCLPRMHNFHNPKKERWVAFYMKNYGHMMQPVLERIRQEGPLSSKDFKAPPQKKGHTGWALPKAAKGALELLFWKGDLMVTERRKSQKIYDLTERVLPDTVDTSFPDEDEISRFLVRRALTACGVAQEKDIHAFMQPEAARDAFVGAASREVMVKTLHELVEDGEVVPVEIKADPSADTYAFADTLEKSAKLKKTPPRVHLLSPFDSLIIRRERTKRLFGFDYILECYVPAAKRKYGYYVLPILWGENFVGRLDPKADRKKKTLIIRNLIFEPDFKLFDAFLPLFADKLGEFVRFNKCTQIKLEKVSPAKIKSPLKRLLKSRDCNCV